MSRVQKNYHPKKFLADGTINPKWKPRPSGKRRTPRKGKHAPQVSKFRKGAFVAWDGEGATLADGRHVYVLLANSTGAYIHNPAGLSTAECLDFIVSECARMRRCIHVGFVFSYDVSMILLQSLPYETARSVWRGAKGNGHATYWRDYAIEYRPRKEFRVRYHKMLSDEKPKKALIWDVFGFFQSSFLRAVEDWLGEDYPDLSVIRDGKGRRSQFDPTDISILPYCLAECRALVAIMERLHASILSMSDEMETAGLIDRPLSLSRWDGAGALAAMLMRAMGIKAFRGPDLPDAIQAAAEYAYFGGRAEIGWYGRYEGDVFRYDINSAYPSQQVWCPDLSDGTWTYSTEMTPGSFQLVHVRWDLSSPESAPWYPFPFRGVNGEVIFPARGEGWYWSVEVDAALSHLPYYRRRSPSARIDVLETWTFSGSQHGRQPFQYLSSLYRLRAEWKKDGNAAQKPAKLAINSHYGKTAQSAGYRPETGRKPPYHQIAWAGYITAAARAQVYRAIMQRPDDILMVATDGLYSRAPLNLRVASSLGNWEASVYQEIVLVQSGVYWYREGEDWHILCRGFDRSGADAITREAVLDAWRSRQPQTAFPSTRFQGFGSSVASLSQWQQRNTWRSLPGGRILTLSTAGTKRTEYVKPDGTPLWRAKKRGLTPADGLVRTFPAYNHSLEMSARYQFPWDRQEETIDGIGEKEYMAEHDDSEHA